MLRVCVLFYVESFRVGFGISTQEMIVLSKRTDDCRASQCRGTWSSSCFCPGAGSGGEADPVSPAKTAVWKAPLSLGSLNLFCVPARSVEEMAERGHGCGRLGPRQRGSPSAEGSVAGSGAPQARERQHPACEGGEGRSSNLAGLLGKATHHVYKRAGRQGGSPGSLKAGGSGGGWWGPRAPVQPPRTTHRPPFFLPALSPDC